MGTPTVPDRVERAIGKLWLDRRMERFDTEEDDGRMPAQAGAASPPESALGRV